MTGVIAHFAFTAWLTDNKSNIPTKDNDLLSVSQAVNAKWAITPVITLVYITQDQFSGVVSSFGTILGTRQSEGSERPAETSTLKTIDEKINTAASKVKTYIDEKYDTIESARANYARFGFVHRGRHYEIPRDHDNRKNALPLMVAPSAAR